jgi:hypothetical protein
VNDDTGTIDVLGGDAGAINVFWQGLSNEYEGDESLFMIAKKCPAFERIRMVQLARRLWIIFR